MVVFLMVSLAAAEPVCVEGDPVPVGESVAVTPPIVGFDTLQRQCGSGTGGGRCDVTLSGSEGVLQWSNTSWHEDMVDVDPIPAPVLAWSEEDRARLAKLLYSRVCDGPDPTFRRLQSPDGPLEWRAGPVVIETPYIVEHAGAWHRVKTHTQRGLVRELGEPIPMLLDETPQLRAWRYAHGVVLEMVDGAWYAWAWVNPGGLMPYPSSKLRFPTPIEGGFVGDELILSVGRTRLSDEPVEQPQPAAQVRIPLVLPVR